MMNASTKMWGQRERLHESHTNLRQESSSASEGQRWRKNEAFAAWVDFLARRCSIEGPCKG